MNIGEKLHRLILISKISKKELSERSGVPLTTIDSIIRRKSKTVNFDTLQKLANALEVNTRYFLEIKDNNSAITISPEEGDLIMKYRFLDEHGKDLINVVLEHEVSRIEKSLNIKFNI